MRRLHLFLAALVAGVLLTAAACGTKTATKNTTNAKTGNASANANAVAQNLNAAPVEMDSETAVVSVTSSGFNPPSITVRSGTTVTFRNDGTGSHWVASDPHPSHTGLPGFDLGGMQPGQFKTFTFEKTGTFGYHDHLDAKIRGTIVVRE